MGVGMAINPGAWGIGNGVKARRGRSFGACMKHNSGHGNKPEAQGNAKPRDQGLFKGTDQELFWSYLKNPSGPRVVLLSFLIHIRDRTPMFPLVHQCRPNFILHLARQMQVSTGSRGRGIEDKGLKPLNSNYCSDYSYRIPSCPYFYH